MEFKKYFFGLAVSEREVFAKKVNSTVGHLRNCAYGYAPFAPALCLSIEINSGQVSRAELRPDDCHLIWPDLQKTNRSKSRTTKITATAAKQSA